MDAESSGFRAGFACFVGRPNVGKSTLMNALVGTKVAITSSKPQTTRRAIRGIVHRPDAQLVIVDTPGFHRPRTLLGERLDSLVLSTLTEVDVIGFCVPANEPIGKGDRFIVDKLAAVKKTPVVAVVTKCDLATREQIAHQLLAVSALADFAEIVPVSAQGGEQLDVLADVLVKRLPESPPLCSRRGTHRRAGADAGRRADPGGRTGGRARRAAPLDRGGRGGDAPPGGS